MAVNIIGSERFVGGIAIGLKEGIPSSYQFGYGANVHDEPSQFTALPGSLNVLSGTATSSQTVGPAVQTGQIKWIVSGQPYVNAVFAYDSNGALYREDEYGNWTVIRQVANSVGQGLIVFSDYLYYVQNTQIGRYGPLDNTATFTDNWQTGLYDTSKIGFAPVLLLGSGSGFAVGNGNNVSTWNGSNWNLNSNGSAGTNAALLLPSQSLVISMCRIEQYVAIGTLQGTSTLTSQQGAVYMWDGTSNQYNFFNTTESGAMNCLANYRNQPISVIGTQGTIYLGVDPFTKVHQLPKLPISSSVQVYPGAISNWKGRTMIGFAATSADQNFVRGVYGWGAKNNSYPDALTCDYLASTGNSGSTVAITAVTGLGNYLYFAWQDGANFGLDKVSPNNAPTPSARIDFLVFDGSGNIMPDEQNPAMGNFNSLIAHAKSANVIRVDHLPLRTGESVSIYYVANRSGSFSVPQTVHSYSASESYPENVVTRFPIPPNISRFNEAQWGVSIGSGLTSPTVTGVTFGFDDLADEPYV